MKRHHAPPQAHLHSGEHRPRPGSPQLLQEEIERERRAAELPKGFTPPRASSARMIGMCPSAGSGGIGGHNRKRAPITLAKVFGK